MSYRVLPRPFDVRSPVELEQWLNRLEGDGMSLVTTIERGDHHTYFVFRKAESS